VGAAARLLLATGNAGKVREFESLLLGQPLEILSLADSGPVDFPEEGDRYAENAVAKALAAARTHGVPALADDSGLEVAALGGGPGPRSARYGGPGLDAAGRVAHLLSALAGIGPDADRSARFVCHAAFAMPSGLVEIRFGQCRGRILEAPVGGGGFGYDPVFGLNEPGEPALAMAELAEADKNRISHRARAVGALLPALLARLAGAPAC